jgi:hypothetical protein
MVVSNIERSPTSDVPVEAKIGRQPSPFDNLSRYSGIETGVVGAEARMLPRDTLT